MRNSCGSVFLLEKCNIKKGSHSFVGLYIKVKAEKICLEEGGLSIGEIKIKLIPLQICLKIVK